MNLDKKVAVVTGGSRGIGAGVAERLKELGARVIVADRQTPAAASDTEFVSCDVREEKSVHSLIERTVSRHGRLDLLVNNAGISDPGSTPVEELTLEVWDEILSTNLTGVFLCSKHAAPHLRRSKGTIVNISSTRALQSEANTEAYSASKGGVVALTHALAISLGPDVRVNAISPGWIDTRGETLRVEDHTQHPAGRVGRPGDIAALVAFLASDDARFITGQNHVVDGGMTRKMIYVE